MYFFHRIVTHLKFLKSGPRRSRSMSEFRTFPPIFSRFLDLIAAPGRAKQRHRLNIFLHVLEHVGQLLRKFQVARVTRSRDLVGESSRNF